MKREIDPKIKRLVIVEFFNALAFLLIVIFGLTICLLGSINWLLSAWLF